MLLSNREYSDLYDVPEILSPEIEEFAMFNIFLPPSPGYDSRLWRVEKRPADDIRKLVAADRETIRQKNLARYIREGTNFEE